jgi:type II secretory pathway component PulJ
MTRAARPPSRQAGATLVEMVVAGALLSLLLMAAGSLHAQAHRSASVGHEVALRTQIAELSAELLRYHVGLAGHRGIHEGADLEGPALALGRGASQGGSDTLAVRYLEERWYAEPELRVLRFDVKRDGSRLWNLYQQEDGATRQPAVQRVSGLRVHRFVAPDGALLPGDAALPLDASALELGLSFDWGESKVISVPLPGVQRVVAETP